MDASMREFILADPARLIRVRRRVAGFLLIFGTWSPLPLAASPSVARQWNEENLAAIRIDVPHPPVHARNLFHVAVAMYDAWAAYDSTAYGYLHHERATAPDLEAARAEAVSHA